MIPKFREWETERKSMVIGQREDFDDMVGFRFEHEEGGQRILMQSTGLKDKNGVEIFEGDIVKVSNHPFQKKEDSAGIEIDGNYLINWSEHSLTWLAGDLLLYQLKPYIEVIGNVFANPKLLEVEG